MKEGEKAMKKTLIGMLAAACALCAGAGSYHLDTSRAYGNSDYPLNNASVWLSDDDGTPAGASGSALPS